MAQTQQGYGRGQGQPAQYGTASQGGGNGSTAGQPFHYRPPNGRDDVKALGQAGEKWQTDLCKSCCAEPVTCLVGYVVPWCCVCSQRKTLLMEDLNNYECCAGMWGRSCTEKCNKCTKGKEPLCLCLESVCCLGCAIHANRFIVMQHYGLQNDCCDVFIMHLACICSIIACLLQDENLENLADLIYYIVIGCMLAQHQHQMSQIGYPIGYNAKIQMPGAPQ